MMEPKPGHYKKEPSEEYLNIPDGTSGTPQPATSQGDGDESEGIITDRQDSAGADAEIDVVVAQSDKGDGEIKDAAGDIEIENASVENASEALETGSSEVEVTEEEAAKDEEPVMEMKDVPAPENNAQDESPETAAVVEESCDSTREESVSVENIVTQGQVEQTPSPETASEDLLPNAPNQEQIIEAKTSLQEQIIEAETSLLEQTEEGEASLQEQTEESNASLQEQTTENVKEHPPAVSSDINGPIATSTILTSELEDFFASVPAGVVTTNPEVVGETPYASSAEASLRKRTSYFPALDNVDLETDEELLDADAGKDDKSREDGEGLVTAESKIDNADEEFEESDIDRGDEKGKEVDTDVSTIDHVAGESIAVAGEEGRETVGKGGALTRQTSKLSSDVARSDSLVEKVEEKEENLDRIAGEFAEVSVAEEEAGEIVSDRPGDICDEGKWVDKNEKMQEESFKHVSPSTAAGPDRVTKPCTTTSSRRVPSFGGKQADCDGPHHRPFGDYRSHELPAHGREECLVMTKGDQSESEDSESRNSLIFGAQQQPQRDGGDVEIHHHDNRLALSLDDLTDDGVPSSQQIYRTTHPSVLRVNEVLSMAEAFAYVSFDDNDDSCGGAASSDLDDGSENRYNLGGSQQGYITHNGIPVIMDDAADGDVDLDLYHRDGRSKAYTSSSVGRNPARVRHAYLADGENRQNRIDNVVADGLASSMERRYDESGVAGDGDHENSLSRKRKSKQKSRRKKEEKFIELEPDNVSDENVHNYADVGDNTDLTLNLNSNNNNDSNNDDNVEERDGMADENNSANNDRLYRGTYNIPASRAGEPDRVGRYTSERSYTGLSRHADNSSSYNRSHLDSHLMSCSSYLTDFSKDYDSSRHRLGDRSSSDMSRLSTRYSHLERGEPRHTESSTVPRFNTLHDQQVSWLEMFKQIEAQHRTELRSQHAQHEKLLRDMQHNMARELTRQQDTLKHSLSAHREILEELSPGRHRDLRQQNKNQSRKFDDVEASSVESQMSPECLTDHSSHITLQGVNVSLKNPPPVSRLRESYDQDDLPVKRSFESELSSPTRPADTTLRQSRSRVTVGRDKQLRGGVYSSPMPLAKSRQHKNVPQASKSTSDATVSSPREDKSRNASLPADVDGEDNKTQQHEEGGQTHAVDDVLSPRTRITLREKHARHIADMRAYYEEELGDLRHKLQAAQRKLERAEEVKGQGQPSPRPTAQEKIVMKENEELRQKCREILEDYHDSQSVIRDLQQKIQGLEIRSADYQERYDQSQSQVFSLGARLEELTEFTKEKETTAADLEAKNKRVAEQLQVAYKKEKELTESLLHAKTTIQRLVDKYEILEKDYTLLKESAAASQEKLFGSRQEAIETNNKLSRLEMDNKQLKHDNEILKHNLTMARSSMSMRTTTSYEDSYPSSNNAERERTGRCVPSTAQPRTLDRGQHNSSPIPDRKLRGGTPLRDDSPDDIPSTSSTRDGDSLRSPILRAEEELRRLQGTTRTGTANMRDAAGKSQRKFYGTDVLSSSSFRRGQGSPSNRRSSHSPNSKSRSPFEKKGRATPQGKDSNKNASVVSSRSAPSSKAEQLNFITERDHPTRDSNLSSDGSVEKKQKPYGGMQRDFGGVSKKLIFPSNGMSGDQAMERIRSGEIVSRPAWEDMYTSMAGNRPASADMGADRTTQSREHMIQERVRNIDNLERKYDDLVTQKRKYESSLSKLPAHGNRGEKDRLETELDQLDKELGSVRMSLKRFHVLKSSI